MTLQKHHNQPTHTSEGFSRSQRFYLTLAVILTTIILYAGYSTLAGTNIATTLNLTGPGTTLDDGLVGHWTFDGPDMEWDTASSEVRDISPEGNHGALRGILGTDTVVPGALGQAIEFDGVGDYIEVPRDSSLEPSDAITIAAWVKWDDYTTGSDMKIIAKSKDTLSAPFQSYAFSQSTNNQTIRLELGIDGVLQNTNTQTIPLDEWVHVVGSWKDGDPMRLYVNGIIEQQTSDKSGSISYYDTPLGISRATNEEPNTEWDGAIDDVRIYNRQLTPDEIKQLYRQGATTKVATTPAASGPTVTLDDGLVGHWTFDGGDLEWQTSGAEVRDLSPEGNHGDIEGSLTNRSVTDGSLGQALEFDGSDDYIDIPNTSGLDINANEVTISAWIKADSTSGSPLRRIISMPTSETTGTEKYALFIRNDGIEFTIRANGDDDFISTPFTDVGQWHHVVGVYESPTMQIYLDGVLVTEEDHDTAGPIDATSDGNLQIGRYGPSFGQYFDGSIDDARVYNRALSEDEIKQLYRQGATTKVATTPAASGPGTSIDDGLVGHWTFDGGDLEWQTTGAEVRDRSPEGNHGDIEGSLTNRSVTDGPLGQAMVFDGVSDHVDLGDVSSLDITGDLTVTAWVKTTDDDGPIFSKYAYSGSKGYLLWFYGPTDELEFVINGATQSGAKVSATPYLDDNWHHVVGVCGGTEPMRIYVDGEEATSYTQQDNCAPITSPTGHNAQIGERTDNSSILEGYLDDVRLYNRALSEDEIKQLYRMGR